MLKLASPAVNDAGTMQLHHAYGCSLLHEFMLQASDLMFDSFF